MASHMKWPLEQWVRLVKPKFIGKSATIVGSLVGELNYVVIKKAILDAYAVTSEGYRQQFRNFIKPHDTTWTEFACNKKWLKSENVTDFDKLVKLMVTEEFKRCLPQNIMMYISDKEESDLKKAAILADNYSLIHKVHSKGSHRHVKQHKLIKQVVVLERLLTYFVTIVKKKVMTSQHVKIHIVRKCRK